jgi:hypothetical protein
MYEKKMFLTQKIINTNIVFLQNELDENIQNQIRFTEIKI